MWLGRVGRLWRNLRHREAVERDLTAELAALRALLIEEQVAAGVEPEEARRRAACELGSVESIKEQVRDIRAGAALETVARDLRHSFRLLRRNPLFSVTASASLAIGIGATTAIFTVANGLLLQSAPGVADADRVVDIVITRQGGPPGLIEITYPDYQEIRRQAQTLASVFAYQLTLQPVSLREDESDSQRAMATFVTTNYFTSLGIGAAAGRMFTESDSDNPGASPAVVISHSYWMRRFGGDRSVIGLTIHLNGVSCTLVGVAPAIFHGTTILAPDLWLPVGMIGIVEPGSETRMLATKRVPWLMLGGRLRDRVTREQASSEIATLASTLTRDTSAVRPPQPRGARQLQGTPVWSVQRSSPVPYAVRSLAAAFIALLMALVTVVLLITCANLAGVLLARAAARRREMGVRIAIGAGRGRVIRQLLTETAALFFIGSVAGLVLARWLTTVLLALLPDVPVPIDLNLQLDWRVITFAIGMGLLAAVLAGIAPALHASGADVLTALKEEDISRERLWLRNGFVVLQVAFSLALVVVAGLLLKTLGGRVADHHGLDARGVDIVSIDLQTAGYTPDTGLEFVRRLVERARGMPGVSSAAVANRTPSGVDALGYLKLPDAGPDDGFVFMNWTVVGDEYFSALRIPIVAGRAFTAADRASAPRVAIVGATAARRLWPGQNPVGQYLLAFEGNPENPSNDPPVRLEVVGVAGDIGSTPRDRGGPSEMALYVPLQQRYRPTLTLFVRSTSGAGRARDLRALLASLDRHLAVLTIDTLERATAGPVETQLRIGGTVAGSVGLVGLLLAALGVYGVTAYAVTRRTREIAIRLTLGANRRDVVGLVLRQGMMLVAIGAGAGLVLAAVIVRLLSRQAFAVAGMDAAISIAALVLFAGIGLIACYTPVQRASGIDPMKALRTE